MADRSIPLYMNRVEADVLMKILGDVALNAPENKVRGLPPTAFVAAVLWDRLADRLREAD